MEKKKKERKKTNRKKIKNAHMGKQDKHVGQGWTDPPPRNTKRFHVYLQTIHVLSININKLIFDGNN